jgi:hypothetical protein
MPDTHVDYISDNLINKILDDNEIIIGSYLWNVRNTQRDKIGLCNIDENNIIDIIDKDKDCNYNYGWGAIIFKKVFENYIKIDDLHLGYSMKLALNNSIKIPYEIINGQYWDCGTVSEYKEYLNFLDNNKPIYIKGLLIILAVYIENDECKLNEEHFDDAIRNFEKCEQNGILLSVFRAIEGFDENKIDFGVRMYYSNTVDAVTETQRMGRMNRTCNGKIIGYFATLELETDLETMKKNIILRLKNWITFARSYTNKGKLIEKEKVEQQLKEIISMYIDADIIKVHNIDIENEIIKEYESGDMIRDKIRTENKRRFELGEELIDTQKKCLQFMSKEKQEEMNYIHNWVKFALSETIFNKISKKYYNNINDFVKASNNINIYNAESYKIYHNKDKKLPPYDYVNSGYYSDLNSKFNLDIILAKSMNDYDN